MSLFYFLYYDFMKAFLKKDKVFLCNSGQSDIHYIPHIGLKLTVTLPPILLSARTVGECHYAWLSLNFLNVCWHMIIHLHEKTLFIIVFITRICLYLYFLSKLLIDYEPIDMSVISALNDALSSCGGTIHRQEDYKLEAILSYTFACGTLRHHFCFKSAFPLLTLFQH